MLLKERSGLNIKRYDGTSADVDLFPDILAFLALEVDNLNNFIRKCFTYVSVICMVIIIRISKQKNKQLSGDIMRLLNKEIIYLTSYNIMMVPSIFAIFSKPLNSEF